MTFAGLMTLLICFFILVPGHADLQPRATNASVANRALNRGIDITLVTHRERHGASAEAAGTGGDSDPVPVAAVDSGAAIRAASDKGASDDGAAAGSASTGAGSNTPPD